MGEAPLNNTVASTSYSQPMRSCGGSLLGEEGEPWPLDFFAAAPAVIRRESSTWGNECRSASAFPVLLFRVHCYLISYPPRGFLSPLALSIPAFVGSSVETRRPAGKGSVRCRRKHCCASLRASLQAWRGLLSGWTTDWSKIRKRESC